MHDMTMKGEQTHNEKNGKSDKLLIFRPRQEKRHIFNNNIFFGLRNGSLMTFLPGLPASEKLNKSRKLCFNYSNLPTEPPTLFFSLRRLEMNL